MAKIYIPRIRYNNDDNSVYKNIVLKLTSLGHNVLVDDLEYGNEIEKSFKNLLNVAQIIIPIITEETLKSNHFYNELIQLRNYTSHSRENKLLIPIVDSSLSIDLLPDILITINFIQLESHSDYSYERAAKKINDAINSFLGKKIATEEKAQELKEKIENKAPGYISETLIELTSREKYQRNIATFWYILGFLSIISGIAVAYLFANHGIIQFKGKENWSLTVFYSLKSLFIIILLISSSKYCFNLAKSYMVESLKVADRIHAISFGKFYLQVFDQQLDSNELKEIFRDWNINNTTTSFSNQTASEFDPKIFEKTAEIIDKIRNKEK